MIERRDKTGPFDVDLMFAPDGISSFAEAKARGVTEGIPRGQPPRHYRQQARQRTAEG